MNNSNRKRIDPEDLIVGNEYDLEIMYSNHLDLAILQGFVGKERNMIYKKCKWDPYGHPHLLLFFDTKNSSGYRYTTEIEWSPLNKIYPSYSSYTLKEQLKDSKEPNALSALDKATGGVEDLNKHISEFGGGKRKRTTRKQKGCKKKKSRRKQKGCKKKKSRRSKK